MHVLKCVICEARSASLMCSACARSYDRARMKDLSIWAALEWAAKRARASVKVSRKR